LRRTDRGWRLWRTLTQTKSPGAHKCDE
jgi:hypothetical protein